MSKENKTLIDIAKCRIDGDSSKKEKDAVAALMNGWDANVENLMLAGFVRFYNDVMRYRLGHDNEEDLKKHWPDIQNPDDLLKHTGTDCYVHALDENDWDEFYGGGKIVVLTLDCPWGEDLGWAAVFKDEEFLCVALDGFSTAWLQNKIKEFMIRDDRILIKGGRVLDPAGNIDRTLDVLVDDGKITAIGEIEPVGDETVIPATGLWVVPGLIDLHAHFREPGQTHKEDLASGAAAAVAGGFTTVCVMPNTDPPVDKAELIEFIRRRSGEIGLADILPIGAISIGMHGVEPSDFDAMAKAGAVGFSDDGKTVRNAALQKLALKHAAALNVPIFSHCEDVDLMAGGVMHDGKQAAKLGLSGICPEAEDVMIARDIVLAEHTGAHLHICHVSTAMGVQLVREAKARGAKITAEVCPHHFTLCDEDILTDDANFKMNPPLRGEKDIAAIKKGLADGTIDAIATDHAPHHAEEKAVGFAKAPFGVVGLETAFSLSMALVEEGLISPLKLIELMSTNPAKILGMDKGRLSLGAAADIVIIDPSDLATHRIFSGDFKSKSHNTPFLGRAVRGRVDYTIARGRVVFRHNCATCSKYGSAAVFYPCWGVYCAVALQSTDTFD